MTEIESITVEIRCRDSYCPNRGVATIVAANNGDLVLYPLDWTTVESHGQIEVLCPHHKEKQ